MIIGMTIMTTTMAAIVVAVAAVAAAEIAIKALAMVLKVVTPETHGPMVVAMMKGGDGPVGVRGGSL